MTAGSRREAAPSSGKLARYQRKRDFARTPEPPGMPESHAERPDGGAARFVVQRHRARRLHYDVRLEIGGVLASWAVPKGPTLDPACGASPCTSRTTLSSTSIRRRDPGRSVRRRRRHRLGPRNVGADGTTTPAAAVAAGELHATCTGEKLRGRFVLVRTKARDRAGRGQWLLLHKRDEYAVEGWDPEDHPRSVLSGRTNDEVKADPERCGARTAAAQASVAIEGPRVRCPVREELTRSTASDRAGDLEGVRPRAPADQPGQGALPAAGGDPPVTKRDLIRYAADRAHPSFPT